MLELSSALTWTATPLATSRSETLASAGRGGLERRAAGQLAADRAIAGGAGGHDDRPDIALVDLADEFGIGNRLARRGFRSAADHLHEQDQCEEDPDPDEQASGPGIAGLVVVVLVHVRPSGRAPCPLAPKISRLRSITMRCVGEGCVAATVSRWRPPPCAWVPWRSASCRRRRTGPREASPDGPGSAPPATGRARARAGRPRALRT